MVTFARRLTAWFVAVDVCGILGYVNHRDIVTKHCREGGVSKRYAPTSSGEQEITFIKGF